MIKILLSILLILCQFSFAQTRTGSGGVIDIPNDSLLPESEEGLSGVKSGSFEQILTFATKSFETQDNKCRTEGHRYLEIKQSDFMQLYLKLSVLNSTFIADNKCEDVNVYFKCLYTPAVKKDLKVILENKEMRKYIQNKYNLKKKEVREVIKFFKNLDKSCMRNGCKM